ncbi:hypothetical protein EVA_18152 [gut metagenome]|uniref:Uncharacterized protein n=1 Tax=gut metagenome TaxID=749906 RepID=J9C1N6_9ZZZZ
MEANISLPFLSIMAASAETCFFASSTLPSRYLTVGAFSTTLHIIPSFER